MRLCASTKTLLVLLYGVLLPQTADAQSITTRWQASAMAVALSNERRETAASFTRVPGVSSRAQHDSMSLPREGLRPTDAWLHAGSSASIQFMGYGGLRALSVRQRDALITSVAVALLAGVGKELHDRAGHGDPSVRDLFWDVVGIGVGVGLSRIADR